ncbi:MAG: diguanylate cyclase [Actinomycetota bacterium]|nr:diguanylate cyclase [Actinomycetota bacterium]
MASKEYSFFQSMQPDLVLRHDVRALDGSLLLHAGTELSAPLMKDLISSRKRAFQTAFLTDYGSIRKDIAELACTPPYDTIFKERESVDVVLESIRGTQLAIPLLEALDFFRGNDFYSYRHCLMVFALSMLVAREITSDYKDLIRLASAGPVHDIGLASMPLNVLKKSTPLTPEERGMFESHSAAGYVLLSYYLGNTINLACVLARDHHEKRDGSGYPRGTMPNDLLIEITAVCDIYDALLSPRPYRSASFDNRSALEELTHMAQEGRVRWEIVKALVALNRRTGSPPFQTEISLERRGAAPAGNLYGIIEKSPPWGGQNILLQEQAATGKIHALFRPLPKESASFKEDGYASHEVQDANSLYRFLFEQSPDGIIIINTEGKVVHCNEAALSQTEYTREELAGNYISETGLFGTAGEYQTLLYDKPAANKNGFETMFRTRSGAAKHVYVTSQLVNIRGQNFFHLVLRDITPQKKAEEALQESEKKYRSLVEGMDDSIYVVDRDYKYVFMNKRHAMRMGLSVREYIGHSYCEFHSSEETKGFMNDVDKVFKTGEPIRHEYKSKRDGRYFVQIISPIRDRTGETMAAIVSRDLTERKKIEEELRRLSFTDELTGLYNRRGFTVSSEQLLKLYKRNGQKAFLFFADLDGLKRINDSFGHDEGDRALIAAANILKTTCRESDVIARIAGDEFVVFPFGSSVDEVEKITRRLESNIEDHNKKTPARNLSMSFGVSCCEPDSDCSIDELVRKAEKLMYTQKNRKWASGSRREPLYE